jgi:hypothetical protein
MSDLVSPTSFSQSRDDLGDTYLKLLFFLLAGYAILGKGFAYIGAPPLLIGEVVLSLGLISLMRTGCWIAVLTSLPSLLLMTLMCLVLARTFPYMGLYGVSALRDSVIVTYGLFAFIMIGLILEAPARIDRIVAAYGHFAWLYGFIGGGLFLASVYLLDMIPLSIAGIQLPFVRPGEAAVHLTGAAVFAILGLRRFSILWCMAIFINIILVTPSRGAMLACFLPIGIAVVASGQIRRVGTAFLFFATAFALAYMTGISVPLAGGRTIGPEQILHNFESLLGQSDVSNLDGTKTWRLNWWRTIQDYTFNGPYFWTGKGFGINLAEADGFTLESGESLLRSPHNGHMTILARSGIPGLVLWTATVAAWFGMLIRSTFIARRHGDIQWANLFLWVLCYGLANVINASFDVALEGPMLGVWFWNLFGLGIALSLVYRTYRASPSISR